MLTIFCSRFFQKLPNGLRDLDSTSGFKRAQKAVNLRPHDLIKACKVTVAQKVVVKRNKTAEFGNFTKRMRKKTTEEGESEAVTGRKT